MCGTIGKQLIRLSEHFKRRGNSYMSVLSFRVGLIINTVLGPIVDMAAYSFASQSLIAPFGGLDVVWNALLAPWLLNERLTRRRMAGCVLIVLGTVLAGSFGNHTDTEYTLESMEETLINTRVAVYAAVFGVWFALNRFVLMQRPAGSILRGLSLGCTAGTIAGNMFCVKAAIELVQRSIQYSDAEIWAHWLPYVVIAGAIFFALTNVVYMTRGLQEYEALFMVTIYEGSMIVSGCVSGAIVLLDLRGLEPWRIALYWLGVLVVVMGMVVIFSQERMSKSSLMSGTASIEVVATSGSSKVVNMQERTLHASLSTMSSDSGNSIARSTSLFSLRPSSPTAASAGGAEVRQALPPTATPVLLPKKEAEAVEVGDEKEIEIRLEVPQGSVDLGVRASWPKLLQL